MSSNYIYEPFIYEQSTAVSELTINHNFGRKVNVQVEKYNNQSGQSGKTEIIYPKIEKIDNNSIHISFFNGDEPYLINDFSVIIS